ncbi:MAG: SIMPL domain-containing protein [Spirochaetia bacterium]
MKIFLHVTFVLLLLSCNAINERRISVEGRHEEEITPDKVVMNLELSEYWREELIPGTFYNDYRNRGPGINEIEKNARQILSDAGMPPDAMTIIDTGTRYRDNSGRDLLTYRRYHVALSNLSLIQPIIESLKGPEVKNFSIHELTHSDIDGLKNQASKSALDNALLKARTIVRGHAEVGKLLILQEGDINIHMPILNRTTRNIAATPMLMSMAASPDQASGENVFDELNYNKIKVSAVVQASFKLKN